jgi:hypothetical protein
MTKRRNPGVLQVRNPCVRKFKQREAASYTFQAEGLALGVQSLDIRSLSGVARGWLLGRSNLARQALLITLTDTEAVIITFGPISGVGSNTLTDQSNRREWQLLARLGTCDISAFLL